MIPLKQRDDCSQMVYNLEIFIVPCVLVVTTLIALISNAIKNC